ncbi:hypothetical protein LLH00_10650 [bacterium]|nr:hypothetical protein [bacterium]
MKSDLQLRAELAAQRFAEAGRKPLVIEFAGVPKAGKTSTLMQVQAFLKRCGFQTEIVVERASVCPIRDKKHANFNVWTACMTLAQVLEKTQDPPRVGDPHVLILDRGIFDSICWMSMLERLARIRGADRRLIEQFLCVDDWKKRISAVIVMIVSPEDAMKREQGVLPVENGKGSIMNPEVLQQFKEKTLECAKRLENDFRIFRIDTSFGETKDNPKRTAEIIADIILNLVEEQIKEEILYLPKKNVKPLFKGKNYIDASEAEKLIKLYAERGEFLSRDSIEKNKDVVQALPIVIVRNASGDVLRLRRREKSKESPLHEKVVIWAGGHVRREDASRGNPIFQCVGRELGEELRLNIETESLRLIGAIYIDEEIGTSKHVAIAFEWRAESDDVAVALSSAEFFERRGTSLSGSFIKLEKLAMDVDQEKLNEPWSKELVREFLAKDTFAFTPRLL